MNVVVTNFALDQVSGAFISAASYGPTSSSRAYFRGWRSFLLPPLGRSLPGLKVEYLVELVFVIVTHVLSAVFPLGIYRSCRRRSKESTFRANWWRNYDWTFAKNVLDLTRVHRTLGWVKEFKSVITSTIFFSRLWLPDLCDNEIRITRVWKILGIPAFFFGISLAFEEVLPDFSMQ